MSFSGKKTGNGSGEASFSERNMDSDAKQMIEEFLQGNGFFQDLDRRERLNISRLDFTIESLGEVDAYLESRFRDAGGDEDTPVNIASYVSQAEFAPLVFSLGTYCGEVIRKHTNGYHWYEFGAWLELSPTAESILGREPNIGTHTLLGKPNGAFTLPLNKVVKYLNEGPSESLAFYAEAEINSHSQ